jgi:hypothetical protein
MFGVTAENDVGVSGRCDIETSVKGTPTQKIGNYISLII